MMYYAHITHDGLKKDTSVPKNKHKVLVYVAEANNAGHAEKQFRSLESEFGGQNFKVLNWGALSVLPNRPQFMGVELQQTSLVTDWCDLPQGRKVLRSIDSDCRDCD